MASTEDLAAVVLARADHLGTISEAVDHLVRRPLTAAARRAEDGIETWLREVGATVTRDVVGNVFGRRDGAATGAPLVIGSHIDTVRNAGKYDGPLGTLLGIAAMAHIGAREADGAPPLPFPLEVVAFAGEEGARFSAPFLGSRVATGTMPVEWGDRTDDDGVRLADAVRAAGGEVGSLGPDAARYRPGAVLAYLEPHIEQGPVLDTLHESLAVVPAIVGQSRIRIGFTGRANHAGTTPMAARHDALAGAAEVILSAERVARAMPGLVATVGEVIVRPGAANVVPGGATVSLDVRHAVDILRIVATGIILDGARAAATARGLAVDVTVEMEVAATPCHRAMVAAVRQGIADTGVPTPREVPSGAGHDAMVMAPIAPTGMLFVRSPGGVSHHPDEAVNPDDVHAALRAVIATVDAIAAAVRAGTFPMPHTGGGA